jgi:hypothetical protein
VVVELWRLKSRKTMTTDEIMLGCEAENKVAAAGRGVMLT